MAGKKIKVEILLGIALLLIVFGLISMAMRPAREPDRVITAHIGDVIWNHELHARMPEISNCMVCHHTTRAGDMTPKPCLDCHPKAGRDKSIITAGLFMETPTQVDSDAEVPLAMTAAHGKCIGCHKAMKKGPVVCRDCHTQTFSQNNTRVTWNHTNHSRRMIISEDNNCVLCHHKDTDAATEGDYRPCRGCHQPSSVQGMKLDTGIDGHSRAIHGQCQTCHTEFNPEDDHTSCTTCHKELKVEGDDIPLTLEQAIHDRCQDCHNPVSVSKVGEVVINSYSASEKDVPSTCNDCHKPEPSWLTPRGLKPVFWDHKQHAAYDDVSCDTCHHTDFPEEPHMACSGCHDRNRHGVLKEAEVLEQKCTECHKERDAGLTTWDSFTARKASEERFQYDGVMGNFDWNHRAHGLAFSCQSCHHNTIRRDSEYVTATKTGVDWPAEAGYLQRCSNCHGEEGPVADSVAIGTDAPKHDEAYRIVCSDCHDKLGIKTEE